MKWKLALIFSLIIAMIAYNIWSKSQRLTGKKFVEKYKNENFSLFNNKDLTLRDYNGGQPIIIYQNNWKDSATCMPFATVDKGLNKIIEIHTIKDCSVNLTSEDSLLILRFARFGFKTLYVDTAGNIFIWIAEHTECPHLANFKDIKYKTHKYDHWNAIGDGWYEENL